MTEGLPVKNTFIHFDVNNELGQDEDAREGEDSVTSDQRLVYWLPSLTSSSEGRRRAASADGRAESSNGSQGSRSRAPQRPLGHKHAGEAAARSTSKRREASSESETGEYGLPSSHVVPSSSSAAHPPGVPPPPPPPRVDTETLRLLARIPRDELGHLTSIGSEGHEAGVCSPCQFWFKGVCINDLACQHCHFMHEGQRPRRLRPSKQGRQRLRKRLEHGGEEAPAGVPGCPKNELAEALAEAAKQEGLTVASAIEWRERPQKHLMSL